MIVVDFLYNWLVVTVLGIVTVSELWTQVAGGVRVEGEGDGGQVDG
jgi:hypothetical protein